MQITCVGGDRGVQRQQPNGADVQRRDIRPQPARPNGGQVTWNRNTKRVPLVTGWSTRRSAISNARGCCFGAPYLLRFAERSKMPPQMCRIALTAKLCANDKFMRVRKKWYFEV